MSRFQENVSNCRADATYLSSVAGLPATDPLSQYQGHLTEAAHACCGGRDQDAIIASSPTLSSAFGATWSSS